MKGLAFCFLFLYSINISAADINVISERLYSKFGSFYVAGKLFDKSKQYSFVNEWITRYAPNNRHPMELMEQLIVNGSKLDISELSAFSCDEKVFGGYACKQSNSEYDLAMSLNKHRQVVELNGCIKMEPALYRQLNTASPKLVEYALEMQTAAYNQNSSFMRYMPRNKSVCVSYSK